MSNSLLRMAVQKGDADLLMLVWAEDEETLCVHPTGVRLRRLVPIRESWRASLPTPSCACRPKRSPTGKAAVLAIHHLTEILFVGDDPSPHGPLARHPRLRARRPRLAPGQPPRLGRRRRPSGDGRIRTRTPCIEALPAPGLAARRPRPDHLAAADQAAPAQLRRERWETPDGDFIDVDHLDGPPKRPCSYSFHGLEGSAQSHYACLPPTPARRPAGVWHCRIFAAARAN
jgi:hypothetical protein